jgi:hypothetical protein
MHQDTVSKQQGILYFYALFIFSQCKATFSLDIADILTHNKFRAQNASFTRRH